MALKVSLQTRLDTCVLLILRLVCLVGRVVGLFPAEPQFQPLLQRLEGEGLPRSMHQFCASATCERFHGSSRRASHLHHPLVLSSAILRPTYQSESRLLGAEVQASQNLSAHALPQHLSNLGHLEILRPSPHAFCRKWEQERERLQPHFAHVIKKRLQRLRANV